VAMKESVENRWSEVRWACRALRREPGTSAVAVLSLALGIGANTAIFSLVNAVLLKMLPVEAPQELYLVTAGEGSSRRMSWNYPDYLAFRGRTKGFSGLAAASGVGSIGLQAAEGGAAGPAELVRNQFVSGNFFPVLGARPALGRLFNPGDDRVLGGAPWAVLGYDYWNARFGADPGVIGRTIRLNGYPLTVVGVAPRGFKGIDPTATAAVFVPMVMHTEIQHVPAGVWNTRHYWWFRVVGRIPAGTNPKPIEAQLTSVFRAQEEEERKANPREGRVNRTQDVRLIPAARGWSVAGNTFRTPLLVLLGVVGFVLLIACANVASVMLARGAARQHEVAIRLAVGAGRARLAAQFLTEGVVIAVLGGLAGVALSYAGIRLALGRFVPPDVSLDVSPDATVLAFTAGVSLLTGILAGLAPAVQATRPSLVAALKDDVPGRSGSSRVVLRRALVVAQVALSLLLLIGASLFVRSLVNLRQLDPGFRRERTVIAEVDPGRSGYKGQREREFYERLRASVEALPGVRSVSLASITPLGGMRWNGDFSVEGRPLKPGDQKYVDFNSVGPRYFETVGIPLLLGREFRDEDNPAVVPDPPETLGGGPGGEPEPPGPRVAIVTEGFARKFLAGESPLGRRLALTEEYRADRAYEVVGVVKEAHYFGLREPAEPMIYLPTWRGGLGSKQICIRTTAEVAGLTAALRRAVTAIDAAIPLVGAKTIEERVDADIVQERLLATLAGFFGVLALALASVGLYGVIAYLVARRTREIGIRVAIGAPRAAVARLVVGDALVLVGIGAVVGLAAAIGLGRVVRSLLFGISPQDPVVMAASVAALALVATLAVLAPLARALGIHPSEALRYE
jgi:predicted permease